MEAFTLMHESPVALAIVVAVVGLCVGSFLNVVIYRLPRMMEAQWKAECAALEGRAAPPAEVFNLVVPRARCPMVEVAAGLLAVLMAWRFGYGAALVPALGYAWALLALTFIDFDTQLL